MTLSMGLSSNKKVLSAFFPTYILDKNSSIKIRGVLSDIKNKGKIMADIIKNYSKMAGPNALAKGAQFYKKTPSVSGFSSTKKSNAVSKGSIVKQDDPIGTATVTCGALNVRNGAGINYQRIGGLTEGKTVSVYEEKDGWIRIGYGTGYGWVCAKYTTYQPKIDTKPETGTDKPGTETPGTETPGTETPGTETPGTETPETGGSSSFQVRVTTWEGLNMRTEPNTDSTIITTLAEGTVVTVTEEKGGWYKIEYGGKTGWIKAEYTEKVSGGDTKPETPSTGDPGGGTTESKTIITTDSLYLRDAPSTSGKALDLMPSGTKLEVLDEKDGWYKVNYNGQTGWCCGDYTMVYDPSALAGSGKPGEAVNYAKTFLGKRTKDLLGVLPYLQDLSGIAGTNNGYDLNCANFVSAILQNFGLIGSHQNNEVYLANACLDFGYHIVNKSQAKPGDVWVGGGHTELVESNAGSTVTMIGSNNSGADYNVQEISLDSWSAQNKDGTFYSIQ